MWFSLKISLAKVLWLPCDFASKFVRYIQGTRTGAQKSRGLSQAVRGINFFVFAATSPKYSILGGQNIYPAGRRRLAQAMDMFQRSKLVIFPGCPLRPGAAGDAAT